MGAAGEEGSSAAHMRPALWRTHLYLAPQALCFLETGRTYLPAKPWAPAEESKWVADARLLPPPVLQLLERFAAQAAEGGGDSGSAAAAS